MNGAIGVFDSGVGGLTVVKEIIEKLPNETIYFFGDTANCPYGDKTKEQIIENVDKAIKFLIDKNVKIIILACNTATAAALDILKSKYNVTILGVINAGVKEAIKSTKNKKVAVLGTRYTINSNVYTNELKKENNEIEVFGKACPSFVPFIEEGKYKDSNLSFELVREELKNFDIKGSDTIVLGCTHYPILKNSIEKFYESNINIVSPSKEVSVELVNELTKYNILSKEKIDDDILFISKNDKNFHETAKNLLYKNIVIKNLDEIKE